MFSFFALKDLPGIGPNYRMTEEAQSLKYDRENSENIPWMFRELCFDNSVFQTRRRPWLCRSA